MTWSTHRISFYHGPTSNGLWGARCSCGSRFVGSQEGAENWAATHDLDQLQYEPMTNLEPLDPFLAERLLPGEQP